MVRCRCGAWTNFGLTCTKCRLDSFTSSGTDKESETDDVSLEELEEVEEEDEEDDTI